MRLLVILADMFLLKKAGPPAPTASATRWPTCCCCCSPPMPGDGLLDHGEATLPTASSTREPGTRTTHRCLLLPSTDNFLCYFACPFNAITGADKWVVCLYFVLKSSYMLLPPFQIK